jgi:hypothetical protein
MPEESEWMLPLFPAEKAVDRQTSGVIRQTSALSR